METPKQSCSSLMPAELGDNGRNCPVCAQPVLRVHCVQCMSGVFIVCLTGAGRVPCGLCVIPMAGRPVLLLCL